MTNLEAPPSKSGGSDRMAAGSDDAGLLRPDFPCQRLMAGLSRHRATDTLKRSECQRTEVPIVVYAQEVFSLSDQAEEDQETLLFNLAYCSRAAADITPSDIRAIVSKAKVKNAQAHITGWLVFGSGIFFQWLEGERAAVQRLMHEISGDARHNTVVVLSESEEVRERLFGDWDMELVSSQDIRSVLADALDESNDPKCIKALHKLLLELDARRVMADFDER